MENDTLNDEIVWQIEERPLNLKNNEWFWAFAIVSFSIIIFSIILKNYLLIVIIALVVFIIYMSQNKTLELHYFKINKDGLYINNKLFPYDTFESFWVFEGEEIAFRRKHHFMPLLIVPIRAYEKSIIKKIASSHLPEIEEEESFLDLLQKKIF